MKALVIYESVFGNTKLVADSIAKGMESQFEVEAIEVGEFQDDLGGVELLVIGGPTHVFGMSRPSTREDARKKAAEKGIEPVSKEGGLREFLYGMGTNGYHPLVATFDTSIKKRWLPLGSAAKSAAKRLRRKGYKLVLKPEQFRVGGTDGPMEDGELQRAEVWGRQLAAEAAARLAVPGGVAVL